MRAGTYNESLIIKDGVSLTGDAPQAVVIQQLNVIAPTTLITMGNNCRAENFTANLSSAANVNLTGINFPSGTSITAKLRNSIWTITSTSTNSPTIIGVLSAGTSTTTYSTPNAIQRSTINVISSSSGITRGILVSGPNRFAVRDIVVYARGSGLDIVGVETTNASSVFEVKTSTIGGNTTTVGGTAHDINRTAGTITVGATDLLNNDANGNSFTPVQAPSSYQFGITNSLGNNTRYYLLPGTVPVGNLVSEAKGNPYSSLKAFPLLFTQPSTVIAINITYTETLLAGQIITFFLYKNNIIVPSMTLTLTGPLASPSTVALTDKSVNFNTNDTMEITLETTGNPAGTYPAFSATVYYY